MKQKKLEKISAILLAFILVFSNMFSFVSTDVFADLIPSIDGEHSFSSTYFNYAGSNSAISIDNYFSIQTNKYTFASDGTTAWINDQDMSSPEAVTITVTHLGSLGSFRLTDIHVGEFDSAFTYDGIFTDVTITGYANGIKVFSTEPYDNLQDGINTDFPIDLTAYDDILIDSFEIYYLKGQGPGFSHMDFSLYDFTIGAASTDAPPDIIAPTISSSTSIAANNEYIDVTFSEPVRGANDGVTLIDLSDFGVNFQANGGTATGASITSITKTTGGALDGSETTVRFNLDITGTSNGLETIEIKPIDGTSVYDIAGNAMLAAQTGGVKNLKDLTGPAIISSTAIAANNAYIDVTLNEAVRGASDGVTLIGSSDFGVNFQPNGGTATGASITSITKTTGGALDGSETTVRFNLSITGTSNGLETIEIKPVDGASVYDIAGNAMLSAQTGGVKNLKDLTGPVINSSTAVAANNAYIDVTFSEAVRGANDGATLIGSSDFGVNFLANGGTATGAAITSITKTTGGALDGSETTVRFNLSITGTSNGLETIEIKPADGTSVYDIAGNTMLTAQTGGVKNLKDLTGPTISGSTAVAANNAYIDVTFSEAVRGANDGVTLIGSSDFGVNFLANGGTATGATITSITKTTGGALDGSETTVRFNLSITGTSNGLETIEIKPADGASVYNIAGNAMLAEQTGGVKNLKDLTTPTISGSTAVAANNAYIDVTFDEAVRGANDGVTLIDSSDFGVNFLANGGTATGAAITSITKTTGGALDGSETTVRFNLSITGTSNGLETIEIKPADGTSVYDIAGNAMLAAQTGGSKNLRELICPTISSSTAIAANNEYIDVTFSEAVRGASDGTTLIDLSDFGVNFLANGGTATGASITSITKTAGGALDGSETTVRFNLSITGTSDGLETIEIKPVDGTSVYDIAGNAMLAAQTGGVKNLKDLTTPAISGSTAVAANNAYIDVTFDEAVRGANDGVTLINLSDFGVNFLANGGTATGAAITSITKTTGGALDGSETTVRFNLSITGTSNGLETIEIKPADGSSVYDMAGNAMLAAQTGGVKNLRELIAPEIISSTAIAANNEYIDVTFSEAVRGASDGVTLIDLSDFGVNFLANGGTATGATITSITKTTGGALDGSETTARFNLSITGTSNGLETIEIKPADGASVYDMAGNAMLAAQTGGVKDLKDLTAPTISGSTAVAANNAYIDVTFDEAVRGANDGATLIGLSDFGVNFQANGGTATGATITSITKTTGGALDGSETTVRFNLSITGTSNGLETIEIKPADGASVYDMAGNAMLAAQTGGVKDLKDLTAPTISGSTAIAANNAYIDVTFDEAVRGANDGVTLIDLSDFGVNFLANGGTATGAAITSITKTTGGALDGSETTVRFNLSITGTSNGLETIEIKPADGASVYDIAGNVMLSAQTGGVKNLKDLTAPTISGSTAVATNNGYIDVTFDEAVRGASDGTTLIDPDKFGVNFLANGGTATGATITSITKTTGGALDGSETTVRFNLSITGTSNGLETIEIKPADGTSVYDIAGNAMLSAQTGGVKNLKDLTAPTINESTAVAANNAYIDVTFSEAVRGANDGVTLVGSSDFGVNFLANGGTATGATITSITKTTGGALDGSETTVRFNLSVTGTSNGLETIEIKPADGASVYDIAGNAMLSAQTGGSKNLRELICPTISSSTAVAANNEYIDVTFSEAVHGASDGVTLISSSDFGVNFLANGGSATGASITSITKTTGGALDGSETTVRFNLSITGTSNGLETIEIKPADGASVYDIAGNAMLSAQTGGVKNLKDLTAPAISGSTAVAANNEYIDVTFSEVVQGASDGTTLIDPSDFGVNFLANGGTATGVSITSITKTTGGALDGSETTVRFNLSITGTSNGLETIEIKPTDGASVYDIAGNAMLSAQTSAIRSLKDLTAPAIVFSTSVAANNAYIDVTFSEVVCGASDGTTLIDPDKFGLNFHANGGTATGAEITSITKTTGGALIGNETTVRFNLSITGASNGLETIEIKPADGASVYDVVGNAMLSAQTGGVRCLTNMTAPAPAPSTEDDSVDVIINDKVERVATSVTTTVGDQTVTTVTLDDKKIEQKLEAEGNNSKVIIPVLNNSDVVVGQLNGATVKNMETKEAVLEIKTDNVTYTLPASEINIDDVSSQIGSQVELKDIKVNITIANPSQNTVKVVENTANKGNYTLVVRPVEFEITCTNGGKTIDVSKFNGYVERTVAIPDGIDPSKITTGIVLNADGTFSHVPTTIIIVDGRYYAKINSLTNSTYSVIWNELSFKDMEGHWAKDVVNDLGSRLVINGVNKDTFSPDKDITRAEFASIVVKALGLMRPNTGKTVFSDVKSDDWYFDAVSIAYEYGIVKGYNGAFKPTDKITREEAMVMLSRAMELTKLENNLSDAMKKALLSKFNDGGQVSVWAKDSAAACLNSKIVIGTDNSILPSNNITRAETAAMIRRMLKTAGLI